MLSVDEVGLKIVEIVPPGGRLEAVALNGALGHVLAGEVQMAEDSPPFDRAVLDGFAVGGIVKEGEKLALVGQVNAGGEAFGGTLVAGQCVGINTGAVMPAGAMGVLMVEHSERVDGAVIAKRAVEAGYGVQKRGADARAGAVVLSPGRRLTAADLAVCAAAGIGAVDVRRLRAALLVTGDELVEPGAVPAAGQIRNSNHPMLSGLLQAHGFVSTSEGTFLDLGTVGDEAEVLRQRLLRGLEESDLLVVSGGMSMGTRDLVPPLLKELGVTFHVEKVRMKPGKPFVLGTWQRGGKTCVVAGLPGNPVSAFVTFQVFVRAVIARMVGDVAERWVTARAGKALAANGDREFFQPCTLAIEDGVLTARALGWKGSADLFTLARAEGLLVRPANGVAVQAGDVVRVLVLKG